MQRPITVYKREDSARHQFGRVASAFIPEVYSWFTDLTTVAANETLLRALALARENGFSAFSQGEVVHLFVRDDFPAKTMTVPDLKPLEIASDTDAETELLVELGRQRIGYTPVFFHGYFVRTDGTTLETPEWLVVPYGATTLAALQEIARSDFEGCAEFFGEKIMKLATDAFPSP